MTEQEYYSELKQIEEEPKYIDIEKHRNISALEKAIELLTKK